MKLIVTILALIICISGYSQASKFDTSIYKQCVIQKIEHSMKGGYRFTVTSGQDTAFLYMLRITREDKKNVGSCVIMDKEIFEKAVEETKKLIK